MSFAYDLKKFVAKAAGNMDKVVQHTVLSVANKVIDRSPVGNPQNWLSLNPYTDLRSGKTTTQRKAPAGYVGGRFRANWQISADAPTLGVLDDVDPGGTKARTKIAQAGMSMGAGGVIYLVNNLDYAVPLEYGHSQQAPAGMVRVTAREFQQYVNKALGELK